MRGRLDLRLVVAATVICALGSLISPLGEARIVFVVPLALLLPGYAITAAAFGPRRPTWMELVPLSVGISLAALALGSIILTFTPAGLRSAPWTLLLCVIVLGSCRIAAVRRGQATAPRPAIGNLRLKPVNAIFLVAGAAMVVAALVLAQTTLHADRAFGFSQLWMLPTDQTNREAVIGVTSEQQHRQRYHLEVRFSDSRLPLVRSFSLAPGETRTLRFGHAPTPRATLVDAILFADRQPGVAYRRVSGRLPGVAEPPH